MKILLTGSQGQVGHAIVAAAKNSAHELIACDRQLLDITQLTNVEKVLKQHRPDAVINAAAYTAVDKAETEKEAAFAVNAIGAKNLALICAQLNIPLLHLSTDYIFDGSKTAPYGEDDAAAPLGVYGASKWQGELAIREFCPQHIILRVSWVFGEDGNNFVKTMLRLMREREELRVVADQKGCPTYAGDIAGTLLILAEKPAWGTYHYCGAPATTWYEFAGAIYEEATHLTALKVERIHAITTADYPTPAKRPQNSVLDCQKLHKTCGINTAAWRDGLKKCVQTLTRT